MPPQFTQDTQIGRRAQSMPLPSLPKLECPDPRIQTLAKTRNNQAPFAQWPSPSTVQFLSHEILKDKDLAPKTTHSCISKRIISASSSRGLPTEGSESHLTYQADGLFKGICPTSTSCRICPNSPAQTKIPKSLSQAA
ncbi:unnamed protein product [Prunus armeniaca]